MNQCGDVLRERVDVGHVSVVRARGHPDQLSMSHCPGFSLYRWRVGGVLSDDSTPHTATVGLLDGPVTEDQLICGARSKTGKLPTPDRARRADVCAISTREGLLMSALPASDG